MDLTAYDFASNLHFFEQGGERIVLDVNSGSLHAFDQCAWDALNILATGRGDWDKAKSVTANKYSESEADQVFSELLTLAEEGSLFSTDAGMTNLILPTEPLIKAICLHVAHDCNLRCAYCFAGTGDFGGDRSIMTLEVGKQAILFVLDKSRHRKQVEVDFFGGEPLVNFAVVQELVDFGRREAWKVEKRIKFTLTTNAVLLNEQVREFITQNDISVVLSMDGRQTVNDRMRPFPNNSGSYEVVSKNISRFIEQKPNTSQYAQGTYYYVRGTYTRHNLDFDRDVLHLADLGYRQISVEPVVASPEADYAFHDQDLAELSEAYSRLAEQYLALRGTDGEFNFFHFNLDLGKGPCLPKRLSGCGAGHEYLAVAPDGTLYPCHQFVGKDEFKVGDVFSGHIDSNIGLKFRNAHIYNKPDCVCCWARFFCSGGCHAAAYNFNKNLRKPYRFACQLQKKRLESALYIKVKESGFVDIAVSP